MTIVEKVAGLDIRTVFTNTRRCAFGLQRFCVIYVGDNDSIIRDMETDEVVTPEHFEGDPEDIIVLLQSEDSKQHLLSHKRLPKGMAEAGERFHRNINARRAQLRGSLHG